MRNLIRVFPVGVGHVATAACLVLPLTLALPAATEAQTRSLSWTETTRVEIPGALGVMLRAMPGSREIQTTREAIHLRGRGADPELRVGGDGKPALRPGGAGGAAEEEAVTRPLVRMTTTMEEFEYRESADDVLGALMSRIEGYRQLTLDDLRAGR
jgi:hypothetical protein